MDFLIPLNMYIAMTKNIFVIDKPKNWTSNYAIQYIKNNTSIKKIGHGGTLDPIATGVLVIGVNNGTKMLQQHLNEKKKYLATIEFGYSTTTYDSEGEITGKNDYIPTVQEIENSCKKLVDTPYEQEVPLYSAVKIAGKELYKYAREGQTVDLPRKIVQLFEWKIVNFDGKILEIELEVSKGFYIRSFVNDLAKSTNSAATMIGLRRLKSGNFSIDEAFKIDDFITFFNEKMQ